MSITWKIKAFDELTPKELYEIFQLRLEVFSVEQNVAYQDADGKDINCFHLYGYNEQALLCAYSRILPAGVAYNEVSIGRVVSSPKARGTGVGRELVKKGLRYITQQYGAVPVRISYLIKFYSDFGFKTVGEEYLEDSLPHTEMLLIP
jgi:ElaA protein